MPILILLLVASLKVAFPDTPAGLMARQWVEAFPSEERMRAFLAGNLDENALRERTLDERMSSYRQSRKKFRSLELVSIVSSKPHELKVKLASAKGEQHEYIFTVRSQPPHRLVSVGRVEYRRHGSGLFPGH
jgi:hypothetical protein